MLPNGIAKKEKKYETPGRHSRIELYKKKKNTGYVFEPGDEVRVMSGKRGAGKSYMRLKAMAWA